MPLLVWLGNIFRQHLRGPEYASLFAGLNLGIHDWNYLLGTLGLLRQDQALAGAFRATAAACMLIGLGAGAWSLWKMYRPEPERPARSPRQDQQANHLEVYL